MQRSQSTPGQRPSTSTSGDDRNPDGIQLGIDGGGSGALNEPLPREKERLLEQLGVLAVPLRYGEADDCPEYRTCSEPKSSDHNRGLPCAEFFSTASYKPESDAEGETSQRPQRLRS